MPMHTKGTTWDLLVTGADLDAFAKIRKKEFQECSVPTGELGSYQEKGWSVKKELKTRVQLMKPKATGDAFEDEVWSLFYKMGFKVMNATNQFAVAYDKENPKLSKQIDVVAIDDETCIFIECKAAEKDGTKVDFSKHIGEIAGFKEKVFSAISEMYPERKCKYIFAVKNYIVGEMDRTRLRSAGIVLFEENAIKYYKTLAAQIGHATRYQLLGALFAGEKVNGIKTKVPAIRGTMGSVPYYTLLMEPEELLKIGYVLHRTNANNDYDDLLPSYQRIIKETRLKQVREFINNGGYFPNSLILSIDDKVEFDPADSSVNGDSDAAKAGTLHLPQTYRSAYIIDGQHRLYGYSGAEYDKNTTVPVVAFEDLSKEDQLKRFMEINENQKAVSKALRNILEIDIYNDSDDLNLRRKALSGRIAKRLGEDPKSPLYGRVIIGEDAQTKKCCISLDFIKKALESTRFFNKYNKKGKVIESGHFQRETNDATLELFYPLLRRLYIMVSENCSDEWKTDSYLVNSNAAGALIRVFDDIINIAIAQDSSLVEGAIDTGKLFEACKKHLELLCNTLNDLSEENRAIVATTRGGLADILPYRAIQMAMHNKDSSFTNADIEQYYVEHCIDYNDDARNKIVALKQSLIDFTKEFFPEDDWLSIHASEELELELTTRVNSKNIANKRNRITEEVNVWTELTILDVAKIISHGANWSEHYKEMFAMRGVKGTKVEVINILRNIYDLESKISNGTHITFTNFNVVKDLYNAILGE